MALLVIVLLLAAGLGGWVVHRSTRLRREAEAREARMLEALFAARRGGGAEAVNIDGVFGERGGKAEEPADEVARAARLQAEIAATLAAAPAAARPAPTEPMAKASTTATIAPAPPGDVAHTAAAEVPVRDLVQVFYEARGFRAAPAEASARPIEMVLTHKSDPRRAYAFAPVSGALSAERLQEIVRRALAIDQLRVLIAVEEPLLPGVAAAVPAQGVRVFDRAAMRAQLAKIEPAVAEKLVAAARRRAAQRRAATP